MVHALTAMFVLFAVRLHATLIDADDPLRTNHEHRTERKLSDIISSDNQTRTSFNNEYGEYKIIQSNVLRIVTPAYQFPFGRNLRKREVDMTVASQIQVPSQTNQLSKNVTHSSTGDNAAKVNESTEIGRARRGKHGNKDKNQKKKKKKGFDLLMHKVKKWMPKFMKKIHGPSMFMLGMAQANFHNFIMQALMMSKMALFSVIFMVVREFVFGDKDHPVKYYNFGYDPPPPPPHPHPHPHPPPHLHHHHPPRNHYDDLPSSDDYQYADYKRRRKRHT